MMKQLGGDLPGQKVYQWDRLNEYKMFTKKINNEISEIEVEENESILSKESNSMINHNLLDGPSYNNRDFNKRSIFNKFESSLIKEEKGNVMIKDSDVFNQQIIKSKLDFEKKQSENVQIFTEENKISQRVSPIKNMELYKASKLNAEIEKYFIIFIFNVFLCLV
jgi:hypothetical protein